MMQLALIQGDNLPGWTFGDLMPFSYRVIMADPPWLFENWSARGEDRNASQHYECMTIDQIMALRVGLLGQQDCALFLWCTGPFCNRIDDVMTSWGFRFVGRAFCWAKANKCALNDAVDNISDDRNWFMSTGYGSRHNVEDCWLGVSGAPKRLDAGVRELIIAGRREHSRKPDEAYDRAKRLFGGPCVELFSRQRRPGWDQWGNETQKFNDTTEDAAA